MDATRFKPTRMTSKKELFTTEATWGPVKRVHYRSQLLDYAEQLYKSTHRDRLNLYWAITIPKIYGNGLWFTVRKDHKAVRWILNKTNARGILTEWLLRLSELEFWGRPSGWYRESASRPDLPSQLGMTRTYKSPFEVGIPILKTMETHHKGEKPK